MRLQRGIALTPDRLGKCGEGAGRRGRGQIQRQQMKGFSHADYKTGVGQGGGARGGKWNGGRGGKSHTLHRLSKMSKQNLPANLGQERTNC